MNDEELRRKILEHIATCTKMSNIYFNGRFPSDSFRKNIDDMRETLEFLLELKSDIFEQTYEKVE